MFLESTESAHSAGSLKRYWNKRCPFNILHSDIYENDAIVLRST